MVQLTRTPVVEPGQDRTMILNMGPQHPSTHGVLRVLLEIDGETVVRMMPDIGYLHTGIEKTCEAKFYQQVVPLTDRIDYLCPLTNNLCYVLAVEKLLGLEIPPKAQWMRVLLNELTRINSHLVWLGTHALDLGAMTVFLYCFREREEILKMFEMVSGQRMMTSYFRIGGLALEPPLGFFDRVRDFAGYFPEKVDEYENLLTGNPIWMMRTKGVARLTAEDAIALGATGPTLRGSGVDFDLRRDMPYSSYEKFQFKVPVSQGGDVFSRYMCRVQELRESIGIVRQALDGMPEGPVKADAPGIVLPEREKMKTQMESLIYHFKIITEGFAVPVGEVYQAVESPRGEMGY
jgi:NADH-quinone oxidoreductase subunit D